MMYFITVFVLLGTGLTVNSEPEVSVFATKETETKLKLTCLAKGLYAEDTVLQIRKDGKDLARKDGVKISPYEPDGNGTYQRSVSVEISNTDDAAFSCEVSHRESKMSVVEVWERHSLKYTYTAFSKPVELPGIHEFTAMGQMDGRLIDYYDNVIHKKVPMQDWMKDRLPADYWEKGTQSRLSKQQWFKVAIDVLKKRTNQTDDGLHILQWMVGCEGETRPDGILKFVRVVFMYNYDGQDFLSFDDANSVWVAAADIAVPTKRKWDEVEVMQEYIKGYLENECIDWLTKFIVYGKKQLEKASPPDVHMFAKNTRIETNLTLTCLATGFYPKDIILNIKRNGRVLTKEDGLMSSDVRPNGDDTYQQRDSVEILKSDIASFTCVVFHKATNMFVEKVWDHELSAEKMETIGAVIVFHFPFVVLIMSVVLVMVVLRRMIIGSRLKSGSSSSSGSGREDIEVVPLISNDDVDVNSPVLFGDDDKGYTESLINSDSDNFPNELFFKKKA